MFRNKNKNKGDVGDLTDLAGKTLPGPPGRSKCIFRKFLARGSYGAVYLAENRHGLQWAVKVMCSLDEAERESNMLRVGHGLTHVVRYDGTVHISVPYVGDCFAQYMEYYPEVDGVAPTLSALIGHWESNRMALSVDEALFLCHQIWLAVGELRSCNLVHRDLKDDNILFRLVDPDAGLVPQNVVLVLADLGLARVLRDGSIAMSIKGTPKYMSPEIAGADANAQFVGYTADAEVFSVFVTFYKIFFYRLPWVRSASNRKDLARVVMYETAKNYEFNTTNGDNELIRRVGGRRSRRDGSLRDYIKGEPLTDCLEAALASMGDYHPDTRMKLAHFLSCPVFNGCTFHPSRPAEELCALLAADNGLEAASVGARDRATEVLNLAIRLSEEPVSDGGGGAVQVVLADWDAVSADASATRSNLQAACQAAAETLAVVATGRSLGGHGVPIAAARRFASDDEELLEGVVEGASQEIEEMATQIKRGSEERKALDQFAVRVASIREHLARSSRTTAVIRAGEDLDASEAELMEVTLRLRYHSHDPVISADECQEAIDTLQGAQDEVRARIDALTRAVDGLRDKINKTQSVGDGLFEKTDDLRETSACLASRARMAGMNAALISRTVASICGATTSASEAGGDGTRSETSSDGSDGWGGSGRFGGSSSWGSRSGDNQAERNRLNGKISALEDDKARLNTLVQAKLEMIDLLRETNEACEQERALLAARVSVLNDIEAGLGLKPAKRSDRKARTLVASLANSMKQVVTAFRVSKRSGLTPKTVGEAAKRAMAAASSVCEPSDRGESAGGDTEAGDAEA